MRPTHTRSRSKRLGVSIGHYHARRQNDPVAQSWLNTAGKDGRRSMTQGPSLTPPMTHARAPSELAHAEFSRIAQLLQAEAGIELTAGKLPLVHSRLSSRLRILGIRSYGDYCNFIESSEGKHERLEMLSVLTTNVTRFYREPHHFEYIATEMMPELLSAMRAGAPVRIWSAGCSTGEEPYTLALTFLNAVPDIARYDFKIQATDIDPAVLRTAEKGVYPAHSIAQVPEAQKTRFFSCFDQRRDIWEVGPEVRSLVSFDRLNLIGNWSFSRPFDIIMCRNVVIYFAAETKTLVWSRFLKNVRPGGLLITGHSERLSPDALALTNTVHTTTYRRLSANSK